MIGVDENIANIDAEGIEHHIHSETLKKLEVFVNNVKNNFELEMKIPKNRCINYLFFAFTNKN